jgi:tetratricopeptide (TPR) repeat protein
MKLQIATLILCSVFLPARASEEDSFRLAQQAYDAGRYAEAIMHYEDMLNDGITNVEVHYNLANACFKDGDLPKAVWHYRKAWYNAPRDPDIHANLRYALNATGAVEPAVDFLERISFSLSRDEWVKLTVSGYVATALLLIAGLLMPSGRQILFRTSLLSLFVIVFSIGGWWQWQQLEKHPEAVVAHTGVTALFGPVEGSTAHYKIPAGALVRQQKQNSKGWVEVEYDTKRGWVKQEDIAPLSP